MSRIKNFWNEESLSNNDKIDCCGCSACRQKCPTGSISMKYDDEGFIYPTVDPSKCIGCGACLRVCPVENAATDACILSPFEKSYGGYSTDKELLSGTTSGGFITELSLEVVNGGGAVFGVSYDDDYIKVRYHKAQTAEEVASFSSSKYVQSEKGDIFTDVSSELKNGRRVLFVGCPCDVYALKRSLGREYDNLLTVEFVCMGVSSYRLAEDYKKYKEKKYRSKLVRLNSRSKRKGWFVPHLEEEYENGKIVCSTLYGTYLGYGMQVYNRPSCFECKFRGENGVGDIRVGDFWGIKESDEYWNPNGVSCIMARNEKGVSAIENLRKKGFAAFECDYERIICGNMSSHKNKGEKYVILREKFAAVYKKKGLKAACRATGSVSFWAKRFIPESFHSGIKKVYHIILDKKR